MRPAKKQRLQDLLLCQTSGEEDWIDWITNFEVCARIKEWDNESKTAFLAVKLKKQAQRVYRDLSSLHVKELR